MEAIGAFDMLKIGVGPSSSHTLGPWRAVERWLDELRGEVDASGITSITIDLYGSLALTGRGHGTDRALCLALLGEDPETVDIDAVNDMLARLRERRRIVLDGHVIDFDPVRDIRYHGDERLPGHANGMRFTATIGGETRESIYYSIGGGFVLAEGETEPPESRVVPPLPFHTAAELLARCRERSTSIAGIARENERAWRSDEEIEAGLRRIWEAMRDSAFRGCHVGGVLPGGLDVSRRAARLTRSLLDGADYGGVDEWMTAIGGSRHGFVDVLQWVSCFALAVNEENAAFGRIVTAPTNGAAGVIPAVLLYYTCFNAEPVEPAAIEDFLLTAAAIGALFKLGATISAAMGGCQAEIGVSSSMAAAALAEALGGSVEQCLQAAEIAMEHHLGMTCDPVGGLVQVPCIERNAMGAIKAITAARLALDGDPSLARVSLDDVIRTMWNTARDMHDSYKETSRGGLAVNISVRVPEC